MNFKVLSFLTLILGWHSFALGQCLNTCNTINTFIGIEAGRSNTSGQGNVFLGSFSGLDNTTGNFNTFLGSNAGSNNNIGERNTFVGNSSGGNNTRGSFNTFLGQSSGNRNTTGSENTFLGQWAGRNNTTGSFNVFIGKNAGLTNTVGNFNTFIGRRAGLNNTTGETNTFIGEDAGEKNTTGSSNTFLGLNAGENNITGSDNTYVGVQAGRNSTGSGNVFMGRNAGLNETGSNKLYIDNSNTPSPLIYGDFASNKVEINGRLGINSNPLATLDINESASDSHTLKLGVSSASNFPNILFTGLDNTSLANIRVNTNNKHLQLQVGENLRSAINIDPQGQVGFGIENPERPIHLRATNAIFRIDRDRDDPGFAIVRYDQGFNNVWKSFYFYTRGDGPNNGKFIIADWGTNVSGPSSARLVIANNGHVGIGNFLFSNPSQKLTVAGNALANNFFTSSDKRFKKDIEQISSTSAMESLNAIQGVRYTFDQKKFADRNLPEGKTIGLIAQEVQKVYPELVAEDEEGYLAVNYDGLIPVLIEALKEQKQYFEERINSLEKQLAMNQTGSLETLADQVILHQNQPNPFNQSTEIRFSLPDAVKTAMIYVYDMQGTQLKSIELTKRGESSIVLSAGSLHAGMYLYSLVVDGKEVDTKRMLLTK